MRDMLFAATWGGLALLAARSASAQGVPGRELLDFPVGALVEARALATQGSGGLYNPAALLLQDGPGRRERTRVSVAQLSSAGERGLNGQLASVEFAPRPGWATAATFARVGVAGIDRTETTPETMLGEVLYDAVVASASGAWRPRPHLVVGAAGRYRLGRADTTRAGLLGADVGVVADRLLGRRDLRLGLSTYLWAPGARREDRPGVFAAADARLVGAGPTREGRLGYSWGASRGGGTERYVYASGRYRYLEARAGVARVAAFGDHQTRARFGLGLQYARLSAGVARESGAWLGSITQFTLSAALK